MSGNHTGWERVSPDPNDDNAPTGYEVRILREYLDNYEAPNSISIHNAACQLMSLCNDSRHGIVASVDKGERVSWLLWDAGIEMPRHQPAILTLIKAIRALPELEMTGEQKLMWWCKDRVERWKSLQSFEMIWFESWETCFAFRYGQGNGMENSDTLYHINAFNAHHLSIFPPDSTFSNELARAFQVIMVTLEQDPWNHGPVRPPFTTLNIDVHALVPFLEISGHIIFSLIDNCDLSIIEFPRLSVCNLWKGSSKFSVARWNFWKERLGWIGAQNALMERTQNEAMMMVQLMQSIEQQNPI